MNIKENRKGFTLVELLAIIAILAVIALITYPIVFGTINNAKAKLEEEQESRILDAAKSFTIKYVSGDVACVTIEQLKTTGFLEDEVIRNPKTGSVYNGHVNIIWNSSTNQYTYTYVDGNC